MRVEAAIWAALGKLLAREDLRAIRGEARRRLLASFEDLSARERALDDRLFLGIVGGTGVGKSTLINAIAGSRISRSGDRRPTTDRVVVYRHRASPLPGDFPRDDLARPEAEHEAPGMERLVVLDFPDFDSVEADHPAILHRLLPRLDVLLVVVDEEKYGDLKLYLLLRALPQAAANLHFVMNKLDRLEARYPGRWREVAREIGEDFSAKLAEHAGLSPPRERLLSVSALAALERRAGTAGAENGAAEGDFTKVMEVLDGYRAEKRRRAAKEANLEARKRAVLEEALAAGLDAEAGSRGEAASRAIEERSRELRGILESIPPEVLSPRERRAFHARALDRAASRFAFPMNALAHLLAGRRAGKAPGATVLAARARAHYQPHREALSAAEAELRGAVAVAAGEVEMPPAPEKAPAILAERLEAELSHGLEESLRWSRWRGRILPFALIAAWLWFALHPLIAEAAGALAEGKDVDWIGLLRRSLAFLVAALSPVAIIVAIIAALLAYGLVFFLDLRSVSRVVRKAFTSLDGEARTAAETEASARLAPLAAALESWRRDRAALKDLREN